MATIKVRFDGQVFVPEQPVSLPDGFQAEISILTEEVVSTQGKPPKANSAPAATGGPRVPGFHPHCIQTNPDFDAPLPDEFWLGKS